jgi:hypothetical protein
MNHNEITQLALDGDLTAVQTVVEQRDELLAALEHVLAGALSLPRFAEEQARAAIARVKESK